MRTRGLNIQTQSVSVDKGDIVTQRNLTLKDLLSQLKHHNDHVRKCMSWSSDGQTTAAGLTPWLGGWVGMCDGVAAALGLAELVTSFPELLHSHLLPVLTATSAAVGDDSPPVRKAAGALLVDLMRTMEAHSAFLPVSSAHLCAAMTHSQRAIRHFAVETVARVAEARPDIAVQLMGSVRPRTLTCVCIAPPLRGRTNGHLCVSLVCCGGGADFAGAVGAAG